MRFEWDPRKDQTNQKKHGVAFAAAATAFFDPLSTTFPDEEHSDSEQRFITIGETSKGALVIIAHTESGDTIRLISARPATFSERLFYEENS